MYAALGLDPDVLFIGEVRNPEDTQKAIDAGNLGHLVITTMHANDTFMTMDRLLQRGVPPEQIFTNVRGIVSQRLVRRLCSKCKIPTEIDLEHADKLNNLRKVGYRAGDIIYRPNHSGCEHCRYRGYLGRIAIEEVLELWRKDISRNIWTNTRLRPDWLDIIREQSRSSGHMIDMLTSGMLHVKNGITSLEELEKFFSADMETIQ
jgi:type IV pilus assembly protein PilB